MEEEGLGLQEFRDSYSAHTSEDPLGPSSVLGDIEVQRIEGWNCLSWMTGTIILFYSVYIQSFSLIQFFCKDVMEK